MAVMLVNRATGLKREPLSIPNRVRKGKTAKDRAKRAGSPVAAGKGGK